MVIELREIFDEILREPNVFGAIEKAELHKTIDYVKYLKINGIFKCVSVMEGAVRVDESLELYDMVADSVLNDLDAFPTISSDSYRHGESAGIILDVEPYVKVWCQCGRGYD